MEIDDAVRGLPVPVTQVHLIVDELVSNAVTAVRGKADAEVTIRARLLNRSFLFGRRLLIEVVDNGGGMAPDILEKATAPFFSTRAGTHVDPGLTATCSPVIVFLVGIYSSLF
ncbi:ATP-binding protein [Ochrobactrum sp. 3-3]|uniref:ATP-binding protein n=1 Tax=Ochrobactrum sp. 3-3 TaxID=1830124 RepID=UPI000DEFE50D|nr:ATP-binding protein [Ochrobactrum sp. 3-3]